MSQKKVQRDYADILARVFRPRTLGEEDASLNTLLDELPVCFWMHDENYTIVYANRAVEEKFGPSANRRCYEYFMGENGICSCCQSKKVLASGLDAMCTHCKRCNDALDLNIYHIPLVTEDGNNFIIKSNMHVQDISILYNKR
ncbi:hypothetical protein [Desulforhopalus sp. IMCC35007]|uniref:hypothetical protein n=1 Tax=Desulforhopalus sp. IMCC35007 TaxID=2569543 RepID=UPI0010ADFB8C|nr:hypothetical protein [Desulforhopalus sp. IMCC35007]TKB08187.1 hypothetical protein FCL48_14515 [Desulforhopalus sp. IMCC35007]